MGSNGCWPRSSQSAAVAALLLLLLLLRAGRRPPARVTHLPWLPRPAPAPQKPTPRTRCSVLQTTNITMAKAAAKKSPVKAAAPAAVKASPKKVTKAKSPKKTKSPKKGGKKAGAKKVTRPHPSPVSSIFFQPQPRSRRPPRSKQAQLVCGASSAPDKKTHHTILSALCDENIIHIDILLYSGCLIQLRYKHAICALQSK